MDLKALQQGILKYLETSTIPQHDKNMVKILLPAMTPENVQFLYDSLKTEHDKMAQLNEKEKRIRLKYEIMNEKLESFKKNKTTK